MKAQVFGRSEPPSKTAIAAGAGVVAAAVLASWVAWKARKAVREHPVDGAFVSVDGVRLHYVERGQGDPVVLIHGNTVSGEDFFVSGLVDLLAINHRVIVIDRPGFGLSTRPRDRFWTANAQATLFRRALSALDVQSPTVIGHSWGTLVALEMAASPELAVKKLILVSGYYFKTARLDVVLAAPAAIPVIGDVMRYTVSPLTARLMLDKSIAVMFSPQPVPPTFVPTLDREMLVRPLHIRATAEDAALMIPAVMALADRYASLDLPVEIFAGDADHIVDQDAHSVELQRLIPDSVLHLLPGMGHMLHHAVPESVAAAAL